MSDDQDGCEWVRVSSGTGLPGCPGPKAVKQLCVCVHFVAFSFLNSVASFLISQAMMEKSAFYFSNSRFDSMVQCHLATIIHCVSKKQDTELLPITSPNVNRFSKFFHW